MKGRCMGKPPHKKVATTCTIIPRPIERWVMKLPKGGAANMYCARYQRFIEYWGRDDASAKGVEKNWLAIQSAAKSDDDLVSLFMCMPDRPEAQPFTVLYGRRTVDQGEERRRYDEDLDSVRAVIKRLSPSGKGFAELIRDASATAEALSEASKLRSHKLAEVMSALRSLECLLEKVDPAAKIPTPHWASESAPKKNYVILCASLNRYLAEPKHAALAFLANVNCPGVSINGQQIRDAWRHGAGKLA